MGISLRFGALLFPALLSLGCARGDGSDALGGPSGGLDGGAPGPGSMPEAGSVRDASSPDAGDAHGGGDGAQDAPADGATGQDASGADASSPDALVDGVSPPPQDAGPPDVAMEAAPLDACGICDRVWVCNGFADNWVSNGPQACADVRGNVTVATLYCAQADTINYPDPTNNDGTWAVTATGLALYYNSLQGTMEIDCVPGP